MVSRRRAPPSASPDVRTSATHLCTAHGAQVVGVLPKGKTTTSGAVLS
jgi:hypothetical protein